MRKTMSSDTHIAILAGGASRRMGYDKATLVVNGESLLERVTRTALECQVGVLIVGRSEPKDWTIDSVEFVEDHYTECGPLGGLITAMEHSRSDVLLLACDMPLLTASFLRWILVKSKERDEDSGVAVLDTEGRVEPLVSYYRYGLLPSLQAKLGRRELALRGAIDEGGFYRVAAPEHYARELTNVNTIDDLKRLELLYGGNT